MIDGVKPSCAENLLTKPVTSSTEESAAVKIQSTFRGHQVRKIKQKYVQEFTLFKQAMPFIDKPEKLTGMPKASNGKTLVYLPPELPFVLKQTGSPYNKTRFDKMKVGREVCNNSNYSHLIIPEARVYKNFIIEHRLPILEAYDKKALIGFYVENKELFSKAVREFTGFLCQAHLPDITSGMTRDPFYSLCEADLLIRHDNVALYLENGVGKIGLIDVENLLLIPKTLQKREALRACQETVRFFPYHLEVIIEAAKKFDPDIESHRPVLEKERERLLKFFKKAYFEHLEFINLKNIDLADPVKFGVISFSKKEKIQENLETILKAENQDSWYKNCLGVNPEETLNYFREESFPAIIEAILKLIPDLLHANLQHHAKEEAISSYSKLLLVRTLEFESDHCVEIYEDLKNFVKLKLEKLQIASPHRRKQFISDLIDAAFKVLEQEQEIAYFNPRFGFGGHAAHYIFC